jgi:hypothetical protein
MQTLLQVESVRTPLSVGGIFPRSVIGKLTSP